MSASRKHARPTPSPTPLVVGFALSLLLGLVTLAATAVELGRAQREAEGLGDRGQHATFFLGDVGEQIARLRSRVALGLQESPAEFTSAMPIVAQIESRLRADIDGLAVDLDQGVRPRWDLLRPEVERVRDVYLNAAGLLRTGQPAAAAAHVARKAASDTALQDAIDALEQAHREAMLSALKSAQRRASWVRLLAVVLGATFTLGMLVIWGVVVARFRRERRLIEEYTARLESVNDDLDAFAGRVAHDLKNALGPVVMAPSLLRRSSGDSERVLEIADRTERCSRRAVAMVDALLSFSRASRIEDTGESGAVVSAVNEVMEELAPLVARFGITVVIEEVPDLRVRCSQDLLHIVLMNVCGNAVKYLERQPERRLRVAVHREDAACRIEVEDSGPGIPKHVQANIFDPFFRVHDNRVPGSGIGLATVSRILEARGGRITVESRVGHGSRFTIWIPLAQPRVEPSREYEPGMRPSVPVRH
ncbi:MAG: sensor histidine kinase [Polyangiales bacterium]